MTTSILLRVGGSLADFDMILHESLKVKHYFSFFKKFFEGQKTDKIAQNSGVTCCPYAVGITYGRITVHPEIRKCPPEICNEWFESLPDFQKRKGELKALLFRSW